MGAGTQNGPNVSSGHGMGAEDGYADTVGSTEGLFVGPCVGLVVGSPEGWPVGSAVPDEAETSSSLGGGHDTGVGRSDGKYEGQADGFKEGSLASIVGLGDNEGTASSVGELVGVGEGARLSLGASVGMPEGLCVVVGLSEGAPVSMGALVGRVDGLSEGLLLVGEIDGLLEGAFVIGEVEGLSVGVSVGESEGLLVGALGGAFEEEFGGVLPDQICVCGFGGGAGSGVFFSDGVVTTGSSISFGTLLLSIGSLGFLLTSAVVVSRSSSLSVSPSTPLSVALPLPLVISNEASPGSRPVDSGCFLGGSRGWPCTTDPKVVNAITTKILKSAWLQRKRLGFLVNRKRVGVSREERIGSFPTRTLLMLCDHDGCVSIFDAPRDALFGLSSQTIVPYNELRVVFGCQRWDVHAKSDVMVLVVVHTQEELLVGEEEGYTSSSK